MKNARDDMLFPSQNETTPASNSMIQAGEGRQKSAFAQALDSAKKKDYISLVANSIPLDVNSAQAAEDRFSDSEQFRTPVVDNAY